MNTGLLDKLNYALNQSERGSSVNIVNDKLTLSIFDLLKKSLSRVSKIQLVLRDNTTALPSDRTLVREFEMNPSEALFNAYDITQKNKLQHFEQARQMASFISAHVDLRKTTPNCQIKGNVLLVDEDFMIQGSSSLELPAIESRSQVSNINFDSIINDSMDKGQIIAARQTFDQIWNNADFTQDYKEEILERLKALYKDHSPEFLYYFTLNSLFGHQLDAGVERFEEDNTKFRQTKIWNMLYDFQKDCVLSAIQKISKYNGCIIADSVGLGKTFEALAIIKYYELRQDNVLVLTPAKLYDNWNAFKGAYKDAELDETFYYKIMFHTDLSRYKGQSRSGWDLARFDWSKFDLVVIDESHNFRNRVERDEEEGFTRYQRLLTDVINRGQKTKVLLLSATPVNNSLKDLRNQISIISSDNDQAFSEDGIESVSSTLNLATRTINEWSKSEDRNKTELLDSLPSNFFTILEKITISRSRKHITEFYKNSTVGTFPEKLTPDTLTPHIDTQEELIDFQETNLKLEELLLAVYIPMNYIQPEHRDYYREKFQTKRGNKVLFNHEDREFYTAKMHRFNLFKRLDSSVMAFHMTLTRLQDKIESFINTLENYEQDLSYDHEEEGSDKLDYKYDLKVSHLKREEYLRDLHTDLHLITEILKETQTVIDNNRDNKLATLIEIINQKVETTPYNAGNKKVLVFSAYADTTKYLYKELKEVMAPKGLNLAMISGSDKPLVSTKKIDNSFHSVLSAFSPKAKLRKEIAPELQIDILIGTDCISEGQNLQDCDCVINYDVQWNPVTLIQRFGRIDRIGSVNAKIKMVNFFPNVDLEEYLRLEERVKTKMVATNLSSTGADDLLSPEMNDLSFRSKQLARLKDEVIELEDTNESLALTDLNMNEYLYELSQFIKETPEIETTPSGIFSLTYPSGDLPEGVLFCFKHKNILEKPKSDSSLYPYYLIYVSHDGEVVLANNQARASLKFLRKACIAKSEPFHELCQSLLTETNECKDMTRYSDLLNKAVLSIQQKEAESSESSVFNFGGFDNPFASEDSNDFELISFLILRS